MLTLSTPFALLLQGHSISVDALWESIQNLIASFIHQIPYIVMGLLVFCLFLVASKVVSRALLAAGARTRFPSNVASILSRLASTATVVLGVFVASVVIFPGFKPGDLVAGLGITSVAIGFAFKDILQNFFAGILILWRQPFVVGDQIRSRDYEGTVEDINMRSTRIKTYDGERVILPNSDVYINPIVVLTAYSRRRIKFTVGIGYSEPVEKARSVIWKVLKETEGVLDDPSPWVYLTEFASSSVNFIVYFWVKPEQTNALAVRDRVVTGIKLALDEATIELPSPYRTLIFKNEPSRSADGDLVPAGRGGDKRK